ncbi:MAG: methyltransferase domain protein [Proteobacteria bacterium]|nr:methyltransferase domain protein [Pseudomonadota bacterium]
MEKPNAPSTEKNREPILAVLRDIFAERRRVLEIGSGTGQHAAHFCAQLPHLTWQTSDRLDFLPGIRMWLAEAALPNVLPPFEFDVLGPWPSGVYDAVYSTNTLHIMSWEAVEALFAGLPSVLAPGGLLFIYGPFMINGRHTSDSNAAFDQSLKEKAPHQGLRDVVAVDALARQSGLELVEQRDMPSNNFALLWRMRKACAST